MRGTESKMDIRSSIGALAMLLALPAGLLAQDYPQTDSLEARIWLDRGDEPLLQRGDRVRIYYRTSADAYIAIFHIDTDGSVQLLQPRAPDDDYLARGARDYRLLFPQSPYWFVDEYPGKGYFFMLASPEPFDFSAFDYARYDRGWDLTRVGRTVYQDPYAAIDDYVAKLLPDWETVPYALDFIAYDVGEHHEYPRFLCYDCHGFRTYASWNPYTYACSSFRVVIWDDPYFYPAYRYRGTRVVFAQPPRGIVRFEFKERAAGEGWTPITRTRQPPLRRSAEYREPAVAAPPMREFVPPRRRVVPSDQLRGERNARPSPGTSGGGAVVPRGGSATGAVPRRGGDAQPSTPGSVLPPSTRGGTQANPGSPTRRVVPSTPRTDDRADPSRGERPTLQRRPSTQTVPKRPGGGTTIVRPPSGNARPSTSGAAGSRSRPVLPSRPSGGASSSRPSPSRPSARPPSSGSRPAARPPSRPGGGSASRPAPARKPGEGTARPAPRRKPGGGGGA
jgi:hypothetical protein